MPVSKYAGSLDQNAAQVVAIEELLGGSRQLAGSCHAAVLIST